MKSDKKNLSDFLLAFLQESEDILFEWETACLNIARSSDPKAYQALYYAAHNLKGGSSLVGLQTISDLIHKVEQLIDLLQKGEIPTSPTTSALLLKVENVLKAALAEVRSTGTLSPDLQGLSREIDETVASCREKMTAAPVKPAPATDKKQTEGDENETSKIEIKSEETIRISAGKIDKLIDLMGELTHYQEVVYRAKEEKKLHTPALQEAINLCHKLTKESQSISLTLRMVPIQQLFQRLERLVVDIALNQEKSIQVFQQGNEVTLDKTVIERLSDPLVHILRNAIDHGIEEAAETQKKSKIWLSARNEAAGVVVEVRDNGRGIDPEKVRRKAIALGLLEANAELKEKEIFDLIFAPGFSTREEVSEISGRGIGMSIVREIVKEMGGQITVDSKTGEGTRFKILVPTMLSILDAIIVKVRGQQYAVPLQDLAEIIDLHEHFETGQGAKDIFDLRGEVIPVRHLGEVMKFWQEFESVEPVDETKTSPAPTAGRSPHRPALIIKSGSGKTAYCVDAVIGQQQVFIRPLNKNLSGTQTFSGVTILSDGEPGMILNMPNIAKHMEAPL